MRYINKYYNNDTNFENFFSIKHEKSFQTVTKYASFISRLIFENLFFCLFFLIDFSAIFRGNFFSQEIPLKIFYILQID